MSATRKDEIDVRDLFEILCRGKWIILSIPVFIAVVAGSIAWYLPKVYRASAVVSPASSNSGSSNLSGLASQLGGLASLAGLSTGGTADRAESIAVLQSEMLTERYVRDSGLLPTLFPKRWNPSTRAWTEKGGTKAPTLWEANEKFKKIRQVFDDKKTGLITVTMTWTDPQQAATWANAMVRATNQFLRDKAIEESERHIKYLTEQAAKTDVAQIRSAIYSILESEIQNVMVARGTDEYALRMIDPAVAPEKSDGPNGLKWIAAGLAAGLVLSLLITFLMSALRSSESST